MSKVFYFHNLKQNVEFKLQLERITITTQQNCLQLKKLPLYFLMFCYTTQTQISMRAVEFQGLKMDFEQSA